MKGASYMSRKTYEKIANINGMFNMLEQQIIHSQDMAHFRSEFFTLIMSIVKTMKHSNLLQK